MPWQDAAAGAAVGAGATATAAMVLVQRYLHRELGLPRLVHAPMEELEVEDQHLLQEVKLLLREYWPHPVLEFSGYVSTFWSGVWAMVPSKAPGKVEVLTLEDGGIVSLHWGEDPHDGKREKIALILPGLNNTSRTRFIQSTMQHLREYGFHAVALNYRFTNGLELRSPRFGCADSWRDLPAVVDHLRRTHPAAQLFAVGFSMGAGMLLRHLGEEGTRAHFQAAVCIAAPVDLSRVVASLESTLRKRAVSFVMATGVKLIMLQAFLRSPYAKMVDTGRLWRATSIREVDEAAVCKMHGYRDAEDYYAQSSPHSVLPRIAVPTLVVNAADDPVVSIKTLPLQEMRKNPRLYVAITRRGGHIGWGTGGSGVAAWTDNMAADFMQACSIRSRM